MGRKPDFVLIGAMKAGTTTLFRRLDQVDGITLPSSKEPHFFSREGNWAQGQEWYFSIFEGCSGITGEASAGYSDPAVASLVAERLSSLVQEARLLYALRHPVARMKSHYRHQVLRAREKRPFPAAIQDPESDYVRMSLYGQVVEAYLRFFAREQLLVYHLEDLDDDRSDTWFRILSHIGAPPSPMPSERYNESENRAQFTPAFLWLWERNLLPSRPMPSFLRKLGRRLLARSPDYRSDLLESTKTEPPPHILDALRSDQLLLESLEIDKVRGWQL